MSSSHLLLIDPKDLSENIADKLKGKKFVGVVEDSNGKIEMLKNKINAQEAVYFMTMAIQEIIQSDSID